MRVDTRRCEHCQSAIARRANERPNEYAKRIYCGVRCLGQAQVSKRSERFWAKVQKGGPNDCWLWSGYRSAAGYGQFGTSETSYRAHRYALISLGVPVGDGQVVLHLCDNPPCCNPAHLRVGTPADNNLDMMAKGRARHLRGEAHPNAKLSDAQRAEIRARGADGLGKLSAEFGVAKSTILRVQRATA